MSNLKQPPLKITDPALSIHLAAQGALNSGSVSQALSRATMTLDTNEVEWPEESGSYLITFVSSENGEWTVGSTRDPHQALAIVLIHAELQEETDEKLTMSDFYQMGNGLEEEDHPSTQDNLAARISYEGYKESQTLYSVAFIPDAPETGAKQETVTTGGLIYQIGSVPIEEDLPSGDPNMWAPSLTLDGAKNRAQESADKKLRWRAEKVSKEETQIKRRWHADDSDTRFVIEEAVLQA